MKTLGRSVTFGPKSVEKHLIKGTLKNLTTPSGQGGWGGLGGSGSWGG